MTRNRIRCRPPGTYTLWLLLLLALTQPAPGAGDPHPQRNPTLAHTRPDVSDPLADGDRTVRVLVSYSATNYFVNGGKQRGLEYELMNHFKEFLNSEIPNIKQRYEFVYITRPFDQLLSDLLQGRGDIVAAGLTITPERARYVDFSQPYLSDVSEIVVKSRTAPDIKRAEDLSGKTVHVVRGSSYLTHLLELNQKLAQQGRKAVDVVQANASLEAEDLLQMVNADIYSYTVVDSQIAMLWAQVLTGMEPQPDAVVHARGALAWAVRKENRVLLDRLNAFVAGNKQGTLVGNLLFGRYYENTRWIRNPLARDHLDRLVRYRPLFEKYGARFGFNWTLLAALAFQESGLNQNKRNPSGATGLMQIKPSTAADKSIQVTGINRAENNVKAGAKYLDYLHRHYFSDPAIAPADQIFFTLAAYNAGPARIQTLRGKAEARDLNPNQWYANLEQLAPAQTVHYVDNVTKYAIALKTAETTLNARARIRSENGAGPSESSAQTPP